MVEEHEQSVMVVNNLQNYSEAKKLQDVHQLAMKRFREGESFESQWREESLEDLRFSEGKQWLGEDITIRLSAGRPFLTFNRTAAFIDQIVGDFQKAQFQLNVAPTSYRGINFVDDQDGEWSTAQVYDGYFREHGRRSSTRRARNVAFDYMVTCGIGYRRIYADYTGDMSFEQDIYTIPVANPFTVMMDPIALYRGPEYAQWGFVFDTIPRHEYKRRYSGREVHEHTMTVRGTEAEGWYLEDGVRIGEYFVKYFRETEVVQLSDGSVYKMEDFQRKAAEFERDGIGIVRMKKVKLPQVFWYLMDGTGIIKGPKEFPSRYIPIIPSYGKMKIVDGDVKLRGAIRFVRDAQRLYNYSETTTAELISNAPKNQWLIDWETVPQTMREEYRRANFDNIPVLFYIGSKGNPPAREKPADIQPGFAQLTERAWENMKGTVGQFNDALGDMGPTVSAKAINARTSESETVSYPFIVNHELSLEYEGRVIIDMMPRILDSQRVLKIVTTEDAEVYLTINKVEWDPRSNSWIIANELSHIDASIFINSGPSAKTQRLEAVEVMSNALRDVGQAEPRIIPVLLKQIALNSDWPGARDFARVMDRLIPPELREIGQKQDDSIPKEMLPQLIEQAVQQAMQDAGVELENFKAQTERFEAQSDRMRAVVSAFEARVKQFEAETDAREAGAPTRLPPGPAISTNMQA